MQLRYVNIAIRKHESILFCVSTLEHPEAPADHVRSDLKVALIVAVHDCSERWCGWQTNKILPNQYPSQSDSCMWPLFTNIKAMLSQLKYQPRLNC